MRHLHRKPYTPGIDPSLAILATKSRSHPRNESMANSKWAPTTQVSSDVGCQKGASRGDTNFVSSDSNCPTSFIPSLF